MLLFNLCDVYSIPQIIVFIKYFYVKSTKTRFFEKPNAKTVAFADIFHGILRNYFGIFP